MQPASAPSRLGKLLPTLDVGGATLEAAGFLLRLKSLKHRTTADILLSCSGQLLDDFYHVFSTNTSDSLRGDSPIVTKVSEGLAAFYGSKVEF
jgi:hypothetical protein